MKEYFYFHIPGYPLCGRCGHEMSPNIEKNLAHKITDGLFKPAYFCYNSNCPQLEVEIKIVPIEVEVER